MDKWTVRSLRGSNIYIASSTVWLLSSLRYHIQTSAFAVDVLHDTIPSPTLLLFPECCHSLFFSCRLGFTDTGRRTRGWPYVSCANLGSLFLFRHRSISLMKFRQGAARLPTKASPLRKSSFEQNGDWRLSCLENLNSIRRLIYDCCSRVQGLLCIAYLIKSLRVFRSGFSVCIIKHHCVPVVIL